MSIRNLKILLTVGLMTASYLIAVEKSFLGMKEGLPCYVETSPSLQTGKRHVLVISSQEKSSVAHILEDFSKENYLSPRESSCSMIAHCPRAIQHFSINFNPHIYLRVPLGSQHSSVPVHLRL